MCKTEEKLAEMEKQLTEISAKLDSLLALILAMARAKKIEQFPCVP